MTRFNRKLLGLLICLIGVSVAVVSWHWARSLGDTSTDNAYVRGNVTSLAPRVGGYVTALEIDDNQTVTTGQPLFRIDDRDYRARLAQAEAILQASRARVDTSDAESGLQRALIRQAVAQRRAAEAELGLATKASERRHDLIRSGAVSQAQVDEGDAARTRADAGIAAAAAAVQAQQQRLNVLVTQRAAAVAAAEQAEAARDLARIDLDSTIIRAPVGGVIGNRQVRVGRLVAAGAPVLDIVPVLDIWLIANFKETQVAHILPGQRARVFIDSFPDTALQGVVDSFAPGSGSAFSLLPADNATGNFVRVVQRIPVKIRLVANPLVGRVVPGMSARVEIIRGSGS